MTTITLEAINESEATRQAAGRGYTVVSVRARNTWARFFDRRSFFPLASFSRELLALLKAGLNIVEALETLAEKEEQPGVREVLSQLVRRLQEGQSLSSALEQFPAVFPPLFVSTLRAAERTSDIDSALSRYIRYQSQVEVIRKKIISASIYPVLLVIVGGGVLLFLMLFVVPRFSAIYETARGELPWMSALLLQWGRLVSENAALVAVALGFMLCGAIFTLSRAESRKHLMQLLWRIPAFGSRVRMFQLSSIYRTLGMLISGGIPAVAAARMTVAVVTDAFRAPLNRAITGISEGQSISQAMTANGLTTPVAARLLRVGEQTGNMGEAMDNIAAFYEDDLARWVDWFSRLFEPLLMTVIGIVVGVVVVLMYVPIFELVGAFQ